MKRLLAIGLLISSLSFSFYQYNGKVVNGECVYPFNQREKIVYDLDTHREISEKIQFCKVGVR